MKAACTTNKRGRQIHRSFFANYLDRVKAYEQTLAYHKALNKRKVWIEPLFGEGKQWHGMRRFRLRRLWRVNCEALVIASGQNLKRLLQKRGWGRRPFPTEAMALKPPAKRETEASSAPEPELLSGERLLSPLRRSSILARRVFPLEREGFSRLHHSFSLHATRKRSVAVCQCTFFSPAFPFPERGLVTFLLILAHNHRKSFSTGWSISCY